MKQLTIIILAFFVYSATAQAQCMEDCVWPGDMNANGIVNHMDILAMGFAFGDTGPVRADMSTAWEPMTADDWVGNLPLLGTNFKHCDSNGDGEIEVEDQFIIAVNFNQTNDNFSGVLGNNLLGDDLFIVPQNTVASPGGSLIFDIHLGTAANPISDLHGIGFEVILDTQYVADVQFSFFDSWMGEDEIFGFGKYKEESDNASTAITRINGSTVSGFGKIAQLEIVITDVILGLEVDSTACLPFSVSFRNVLAIDIEENDLLIASHGDSLQLKHPSQLTSTYETKSEILDLKVFPNPAHDRLYIQTLEKSVETITLFNQLGEVVLQKEITDFNKNNKQFDWSVSGLPRGVYFVKIQNRVRQGYQKVLLE